MLSDVLKNLADYQTIRDDNMVIFEEVDERQTDVYRTQGGALEIIGRILRPRKVAFYMALKKVILSEHDLLSIIGQMDGSKRGPTIIGLGKSR